MNKIRVIAVRVGDILISGVDGEEFADIPGPIEELWRGGGLLG